MLALCEFAKVGTTHPFLCTVHNVVFPIFRLLRSRLNICDIAASIGFLNMSAELEVHVDRLLTVMAMHILFLPLSRSGRNVS